MTELLDPMIAEPIPDAYPDLSGFTRRVREPGLSEATWWPGVITFAIVASAVLYTFVHLSPDLVIAATTPAGGDFGAHVWGPAYLRDHILPHWRLSGWAPDWYAGFPMYQYYMVVPALMIVALDVVLPYGVALKIVALLGILSLPICAAALGYLGGLEFPAPAFMAVAATFFLFDETFTIYGGNIASTMAGEFSFSIALSFCILYFAFLAKGFRTGENRAAAAVLFALACLCHGIVAIFAVVGTIVMFLLWADRKRLRYLITFGAVGAALTAFWMLPFLLQRHYLTDMGYEKRYDYWKMLFPHGTGTEIALLALIVVGLAVSIAKGRRLGVFLAVMAVIYGTWAIVQPQSQLWNARLLPFLYLSRYLLAAIGVADIAWAAAWVVGRVRDSDGRAALLWAPVPIALASVVTLGMGLRDLPFGHTRVEDHLNKTQWVYHWGPFHSSKATFVDDWAAWNFKGYERKDAYGEYYGIVSAMKVLGSQHGCGRALWENNNLEDRYGTPMALMLLPFWTNGCIASMEGLFFESSATTPYHFLAASALSDHSSNPVRRLHYVNADVAAGVTELQELGVRYYLAFSPTVTKQADQNPELKLVSTAGPWRVYEVAQHDLVVPLKTQPVVVTGVSSSRDKWLEVGTSYFQHPDQWPSVPAQSGPADWKRITVKRTSKEVTDSRHLAVVAPEGTNKPVTYPDVKVSDVTTGDDRVSFTVDKIGVPVLVKVSYFPNWEASGARGPWRVAPNLMVVIPTSNHVSLHYGRSMTDWAGVVVTGLGLIGVGFLFRRRMNFASAENNAGSWPAPTGEPSPTWWMDWEDTDDHGLAGLPSNGAGEAPNGDTETSGAPDPRPG